MALSDEQRQRYDRQLQLPAIGEKGQCRLLESSVAIVGAGGLGSPAALYLAAAGVGRLCLIDDDIMDLSNLQRQILYRNADLGLPKAEAGRRHLLELNPGVVVEVHASRLDSGNAEDLLSGYDFVIDATDNKAARIALVTACHQMSMPYSHGAIRQFYGQTMTVLPGRTTCYRCVFDDSAEESGLPSGPLGAVPGIIGSIQAAEALKALVGKGKLLTDRLITVEVLSMKFREVRVSRRCDCPLCGPGCS